MNERIRELYEQSWVHGSYQESIEREFAGDEQRYRTVKTTDFDHEYFAALIIRECAGIVKYYHTRNETVTPQQILQHFRVEE